MKKLCVGLMVVGLVALAGCSSSPTGGGGPAGGAFKIKGAPEMTKEIKHGSSEPFKLSISKDKNFKEDINLNATVAEPDKGVTATVEPSKLTGAEASEFTVTVKAADNAQEGEYTVNVV